MKPIQCKKGNGEIFGLLVEPNKGDYLSKNHLQILLKNIKNIFSKEKQSLDSETYNILDNFKTNEKGFETDKDCKGILQNLIVLLNQNITEKVIVPQDMGTGPAIRHRVFYFNLLENNQIEIKYTELGEFNSIDIALEYISNLYM